MNNKLNPATFYDSEGVGWHIEITYGDICRVRKHVQGADNQPLDLCLIAETGDFRQVSDRIDILVRCVYWLLSKDIQTYSGKPAIEAMDWFYDRINGDVLESMTRAWYEAVINFTPSLVIRSALMIAGETMKKSELITAIEMLVGQLETYTNSQESSDSIPNDIPMANSSRWLNPV